MYGHTTWGSPFILARPPPPSREKAEPGGISLNPDSHRGKANIGRRPTSWLA